MTKVWNKEFVCCWKVWNRVVIIYDQIGDKSLKSKFVETSTAPMLRSSHV